MLSQGGCFSSGYLGCRVTSWGHPRSPLSPTVAPRRIHGSRIQGKRMGSLIRVSRAGSKIPAFSAWLGSPEPPSQHIPPRWQHPQGLAFTLLPGGFGAAVTCQRMEWEALEPLEKHSAREGAWDRVFQPSGTPGQIGNPLWARWRCWRRAERLSSFNPNLNFHPPSKLGFWIIRRLELNRYNFLVVFLYFSFSVPNNVPVSFWKMRRKKGNFASFKTGKLQIAIILLWIEIAQ